MSRNEIDKFSKWAHTKIKDVFMCKAHKSQRCYPSYGDAYCVACFKAEVK